MQLWAIKWQIFNATHFKDIESVVAKRRADNTYRKVPHLLHYVNNLGIIVTLT